MRRRIWKYPLRNRVDRRDESVAFIEMLPRDADVLSAGLDPQGSGMCVWAAVNTTASTRPHAFVVVPTGGAEPDRARFLATVIHGQTVGHVYELTQIDAPGQPG